MHHSKKIILDAEQIKLQQKLQNLAKSLEVKDGFLNNIFAAKKKSLQGLYIYGSVGCGKTTLMQEFYNSLVKTSKIYFHFNGFMRSIHEALRNISGEKKKYKDELIEAVERVIGDKKVLCFDEFQVLDIADAMILGRIFSYLFSKQVVVIFTSNIQPKELYKNGLQREVFLEFVDKILLKHCEVVQLNSGVDYRALYLKGLSKRYFVSNQANREQVKEIIKNTTKNQALKSKKIKVWGREVKIKKTFEKIAVINFDDICCVELGASDYQAIAQEFDLIFLLKLPILTKQDRNESRRFTLLIDEIYENKTALIILAKTKIEAIYGNEPGEHYSARTISRLQEIKSDEYWRASKIEANNQSRNEK